MSLSKPKSFLTGALFAIIFATAGSALAVEGMRLWKPYQPESFGGGRRSGDGFYGSLEGLVWNVNGSKNIPVGYRNPDGSSGTREVYNGSTTFLQGNSLSTGSISPDFSFGTRLEVGNIRGHHGWLLSGYGISNMGGFYSVGNYISPYDSSSSNNNNNNNSSSGSSSSGNNNNNSSNDVGVGSFASMVINDSLTLSVAPLLGEYYWNDIWTGGGTFDRIYSPIYATTIDQEVLGLIGNVGYFWGWIPSTGVGVINEDATNNTNTNNNNDEIYALALVPLPMNFRYAEIKNKVDIMNLELMYTYRPHPFKWGEMELLAGARYWDFDDKFTFVGLSYTDQEVSSNNNSNSSSGSSSSNNNNDSNSGGVLDEELEEMYLDTIRTRIVGHVRNRVTGPQIGMKLSRRNARWTFGAEARFLAGVNAQSQRVSGQFATQYLDTNLTLSGSNGSSSSSSSSNNNNNSDQLYIAPGVKAYNMVGLYNNNRAFNYRRTKTYFSPGVELRLTAKWQWTDAVGVQIGFNSTIVDNIGRGAEVIEYQVYDNGNILGFRDSKSTVIVYGFNFGLNMRR